MAKNKENKTADLLDEPVQKTSNSPSFNVETFFDKNKTFIIAAFGALLLGAASFVGYKYYAAAQDKEAQPEMFYAVNYFEQDSLDLALNGDKVNRGFLEIAEEYSASPAGNLSNYYIGAIYLKKGNFEEAITHLKKFDAGDLLVQARAYVLLGDAYAELEDYNNAISYYNKAADYQTNEYFTPRYLLKLAGAYEANNDFKAAVKTYDRIINEYSRSQEYGDARKYKARAEGLLGQ
jgi:tetratricopeptide (TPR) repeat protein